MTSNQHYILPGPDGFKGSLLDDLLAAGYYRMMHNIFTTHFTQLDADGEPLPVFWLRTPVKNIVENKMAQAIRKKCAGFTVSCNTAIITSETEALYSLYHQSIDFNTGSSCFACMHEYGSHNPFDSWTIEIRDNGNLIAAGFFDAGSNAITGILNFYHPAYKKYSLGKYLMLQKINWAIANHMEWYYTGYLCTGNPKFDYKLFPDLAAIEVFLPVERAWVPFNKIGKDGLAVYWNKYIG